MVQNELGIVWNRAVSYAFPGTGNDCGRKGYFWKACPSMRHAVRFPDSCHKRSCPSHWRDWLREESAAAAEVVNFGMKKTRLIRQHIVVSLAPGAVLPDSTEGRADELEWVRWILKFVGLKGGAVVPHAKRAHTVKEAHDRDDGAHYHVIGLGWINTERVVGLNELYGIVVVGFGRDSKSIYRRVEYMLSHAALPSVLNPASIEGTNALHSITFWGVLSYRSLKRSEFEEKEPECYCPGCKKGFPARSWHDLRCLDEPPDAEYHDLNLRDGYGHLVFEPRASWGDM